LLELHGAGIERMLEIVHHSGDGGSSIIDSLGSDALVRSLLLLYGLHPLDLETRVVEAVQQIQSTLGPGLAVTVLGVTEGVVRLNLTPIGTDPLRGSHLNGCDWKTTARQTIELAIWEAAPDATGLVVVESAAFVPLASLASKTATASAPPRLAVTSKTGSQ